MLAASGFIVAGVVGLLRPEFVNPLRTKGPGSWSWFAFLLIVILWSVGRAVWHALRYTFSTFESHRDGIHYDGPPRYWLNPAANLDRANEKHANLISSLISALFHADVKWDVTPSGERLHQLRELEYDELANKFCRRTLFRSPSARQALSEAWLVRPVRNDRICRLLVLVASAAFVVVSAHSPSTATAQTTREMQ